MVRKQTQTEQPPTDSLTELIPAREVRSLVPELGTPITYCPSNLDMSTEEGRALAVNAVGSQDFFMDEEGKVSFLCKHYLVYQVERTDPETGQVSRYPRVVFWDDKNQTFATTSVVIPEALAAILSLYSDMDWQNGIPMCIITRKNRQSVGSHHELRIITRSQLSAMNVE